MQLGGKQERRPIGRLKLFSFSNKIHCRYYRLLTVPPLPILVAFVPLLGFGVAAGVCESLLVTLEVLATPAPGLGVAGVSLFDIIHVPFV